LLFDPAPVAPVPASSGNAGSPRAATFTAGIRLLGRAGISEQTARSFLGKIIQKGSLGPLVEAIEALEPRVDEVAEPRSWILAYIAKRTAGSSTGGGRAGASLGQGHATGGASAVRPQNKPRPLATPEFLGISPARQRQIEEQNRRITEESKALFRRISGEK
jgi:hypothetical protein